jgi:D-glycero-D-manno-heptose 1,7-bisphosphate phosphatase
MARGIRPAVFLDRDGTLNEECGFITRPEQIRLLPGAGGALRQLRAAGFACVVVTNQSAVGRGLMTEAELACVHQELLRRLEAAGTGLDGLYYCPAAPGVTTVESPDRKPAPGMLLRAARDLGLDLARSWVVGDSLRDVLAGRGAGCSGRILVRSGHDVSEAAELLAPGEFVADDLADAARIILERSHQG